MLQGVRRWVRRIKIECWPFMQLHADGTRYVGSHDPTGKFEHNTVIINLGKPE